MAAVDDDLLEPALTAAHRALVRLDDADVPAALRPVRAAAKKRRLPPPLRRVLLGHLEEEWLRVLALAELANEDDDAHRVSRGFLERSDGWAESLQTAREERSERDRGQLLDATVAERDRLRRLTEELGDRLAERDARIAEMRDSLESDERVQVVRRRLEAVVAERDRLQATVDGLHAEIERLRTELEEADERISVLRSRQPRVPEDLDGAPAPRTFGRGNPIELARLLDELMVSIRPSRSASGPTQQPAAFALPAGLRPDAPEAIDWIIDLDGRLSLLIDGHNVAHDLDPQPGRTARDRIVSEVGRIRRLANGAVSAVVFFDTDRAPEAHRNFGVAVRYVSDADSAIEEAAAAITGRKIVISTDREVRARARDRGAITLWGTALSGWITRS